MVDTDKEETKSVAYQHLEPVFVEANKTHTQKIDKLEKQVDELKKFPQLSNNKSICKNLRNLNFKISFIASVSLNI